MEDFVTSRATVVPARVMREIKKRLEVDEDWQAVATDLLRPLIPDGEDDLDEVNEVLRAVEEA